MTLEFKEDQSEEYYRKLLLLDKITPNLMLSHKKIIFDKGYYWDILFNDEDAPWLCYFYVRNVLEGPFPDGEKYIRKNPILYLKYSLDLDKNIKFW